MLRRIICSIGTTALLLPAVASAATSEQLIPLYMQLIEALRQELMILQPPSHAWLSATPVYGTAPFYTVFTVHSPSGTELITFGDGLFTNKDECTLNAKGWCDLTNPVPHRYRVPGTYTVSLYDHMDGVNTLIDAHTILVTEPQ